MEAPSCCPDTAALAANAKLLEELATQCDPTLEACCRRDLEQQALAARLKAQLSVHDPTKARSRVAAAVLGVAPPAAAAAPSDDEDDEDDEIMGRLRAQRMQEMQAAAAQRAQLQQQGHGGVGDVPEARLLREAEASAAPLVAHLALEGSPLDDELDEHLATLAHRHLGTRFVRCRITLRSTLHLRLRTPAGPGLLCFRDGTLVGAAGLDCFGAPECIAEEAVDSWLRRHKGLLLAQPAAARSAGNRGGGAAGGSSSGSSSEEEGEDDWQQPCEVCGRRYPHQHFRSVYASRQSGSDSEPGE